MGPQGTPWQEHCGCHVIPWSGMTRFSEVIFILGLHAEEHCAKENRLTCDVFHQMYTRLDGAGVGGLFRSSDTCLKPILWVLTFRKEMGGCTPSLHREHSGSQACFGQSPAGHLCSAQQRMRRCRLKADEASSTGWWSQLFFLSWAQSCCLEAGCFSFRHCAIGCPGRQEVWNPVVGCLSSRPKGVAHHGQQRKKGQSRPQQPVLVSPVS